MKIGLKTKGNWDRTFDYLNKLKSWKNSVYDIFKRYGEIGVDALAEASPKFTGLMSKSWRYKIADKGSTLILEWHNDDIENGYNIALFVQKGHGTKGGHYKQGVDYINPAMKPVFDEIIKSIWKEISEL